MIACQPLKAIIPADRRRSARLGVVVDVAEVEHVALAEGGADSDVDAIEMIGTGDERPDPLAGDGQVQAFLLHAILLRRLETMICLHNPKNLSSG